MIDHNLTPPDGQAHHGIAVQGLHKASTQIPDPELLASLSMEQLIAVLAAASNELRKRQNSGERPETATGIVSVPSPVQATINEASQLAREEFIPLPDSVAKRALNPGAGWRIGLISRNPRRAAIAVLALGDIVVGRKVEGVNPDLDLSEYDDGQAGISRIHALIRPTVDHLLLSDLGSTNGSFVDGERLVVGRSVALHDGASIAFGKCSFRLRVIERPALKEN